MLWKRLTGECFRKASVVVDQCHSDLGFDLYLRQDLTPPGPQPAPPPPAPFDTQLSPALCDALLQQPNGILRRMWSKTGWRRIDARLGQPPCWGSDEASVQRYFDGALSGSSCDLDWYEGYDGAVSAAAACG